MDWYDSFVDIVRLVRANSLRILTNFKRKSHQIVDMMLTTEWLNEYVTNIASIV